MDVVQTLLLAILVYQNHRLIPLKRQLLDALAKGLPRAATAPPTSPP